MITLKKIRTLKDRVQIRKCGSLMYEEARFHAFDDLRLNRRVSFLSYDALIKQYEMELEKQSLDFIL